MKYSTDEKKITEFVKEIEALSGVSGEEFMVHALDHSYVRESILKACYEDNGITMIKNRTSASYSKLSLAHDALGKLYLHAMWLQDGLELSNTDALESISEIIQQITELIACEQMS